MADVVGVALEGPDPEGRAWCDLAQGRPVRELVLAQLGADQPERELRAIDRHLEQVAQNVRQSADVVLVRVGYEKAAHVFAALPEVGDVRNDEVDAEHLLVREHEPRIDDEDVVPDLEREHVLSDFTDATQGNDPQRGVRSSQRG